jgi:hypothetical protein
LSSSLEISLKQNEADLIMAKKNADLSKANYEKVHNELETEKTINHNLKTQVIIRLKLAFFVPALQILNLRLSNLNYKKD